MMGLVIALHVCACVLLIVIILIQTGRGGGLIENFSNIESMFGPKTNTFLSRTTSTLAILFFLTCLSLALLSIQRSRSLMRGVKPQPAAAAPVAAPAAQPQTTADAATAGTKNTAPAPAAGQEEKKTP